MGKLVDGVWHDVWHDTKKTGGHYKRQDASFRNWITADGGPGPSGEGGFPAAAGRYRLYVSLACPWAHRTLILRALKGLEDAIPVTVVDWFMGSDGWRFDTKGEVAGADADPVAGHEFLRDVYLAAAPRYTGRVSVPVLWDHERATIVSNESSEIIRMLNRAFDGVGGDGTVDFYPEALRAAIDQVNEEVYGSVNNGVYRSGFATSQEAYDGAVSELFKTLDRLEERLSKSRYLVGDRITEADWRLFTTLVRFDPVYHGHFKCNIRRLADYPNLWGYTRELYQVPGVARTVNMTHIKEHYYRSHETVNPTRIVPKGPEIDFSMPHGRERLKAA